MSVDVRWDTLAWHVIVYSQLIEETKFVQGVVWVRLVGIKVRDESFLPKLKLLQGILKTYTSLNYREITYVFLRTKSSQENCQLLD